MLQVKVVSRFNINSDDLNCLHLLYMPLIGTDAISLYLFFHTMLDKKSLATSELKVEDILDLLSWRQKKFEEALAKLEGANLINNFAGPNNNILILLAPLTAKNFISDSNLGMYLNAKIGDDLYGNLIKHFYIENLDLKGYQNVTKSFDEIFTSRSLSDPFVKENTLVGRKPNKGSVITKFDFDIDLFISKVKRPENAHLFTADFKKKIISIAYVYGFTLEQMVNLYFDSESKTGEFDFEVLKRKAGSLYSYLTNESAPELETKNNDSFDLIKYFENTTASELLHTIIGESYPVSYLKRIAEIYSGLSLPRGVINVMITYVYREKGNLPVVSYFEKVADSWQEKGITTTALALGLLNGETQKPKHKTSKGELEDWQQEAIDNVWKEFVGDAKN